MPYHDSEAFLTGIKHARRIEGLPDDYGHWVSFYYYTTTMCAYLTWAATCNWQWYGYFDISVWAERLEAFFAE